MLTLLNKPSFYSPWKIFQCSWLEEYMVYPPSQMLSAKVDWRWVPENSSEPKNTPQNSINHTQYPSLRYTKSSLIWACFVGD